MNISKILKKISFGCGLASLCCSLQVSAFCGDNCCPTQCCQNTCCEDGPLNCNAFGVQVKGGVTPSWFSDKGHTSVIYPGFPFPIVVDGSRSPDFDKIFDLPWQIGAELQWNASTHVQFFAEYVFENAKGKKHRFFLNDGLFDIRHRYRDFETNSAYLGARYYFGNVWCSECGTSSIAPFIGFKGGVKWHERTRFHSRFIFDDLDLDIDLGRHDFSRQQTLLSAGAQIGLDWSINCNFGVMLTVEVVGTQGFRCNRHIPLNILPVLGGPAFPTHLSLGNPGHIISVPVTLGVRYTF